MDKQEADEVLVMELSKYRIKRYEELARLVGSIDSFARQGPSGAEYQLEIEVRWDQPRSAQGNLRVIASIDDGGFTTAFAPITKSFIKSPSGVFVGE